MKRNLLIALAAVGAASLAQAATTPQAEISALKGECAAQYSASYYGKDKAPSSNEYQFVYSSGKYKGEAQPGKMLACTEQQYAAYLDKADPVRVMNAYPTAAGRPTAKKTADYKPAK
ncbi:hypothetical protein [Pelomonas sp. SE-A7]|uniref:hypothetical protein n=1 Tax=Pelomonas sp. SE-A7 TaxID=3054953 RepID=UPI00259C9168|nr:hypothetical protein [Pelomonas sp. SE-A7]MDM4766417.1 hypothetical protein [Pelomonas sp. SE-A7]